MQARVVGPERRTDGAGEPIEADVGEQVIALENAFHLATTIAPGAELFHYPGGETGWRITEAESQGLRAGSLYPLIAGLLFQPGFELADELALFRTRITQHFRVTPHRQQIHVYAEQLVGMHRAQTRSDESAPITALRGKARVAEHLGHQISQAIGDHLQTEACLPRRERQAIAR